MKIFIFSYIIWRMDKNYFCIFGGGGIRGAAYTGAIKALGELKINITGLAGSSIGAVVASLLAFRYSPLEIQEIFDNINFEFFKDINLNFGKDFAISKGNNFYEWMKNKIEEKFYKEKSELENLPPVRFKDLDRELVIFTVDLTTSKLYEFSKTKTPEAEIAHAVRISVAMPGLYAPIFNENECLVDGDLLKSMPLSKASDTIKNREEKILEFRLENNETKKKILNTVEYLNAVYDYVSGIDSDFVINLYKNLDKYDFIKINAENVSVVDFMIDKETKHKMAQTGYSAVLNYFQNEYPKKETRLKKNYTLILNSLKKVQYALGQNDIESAKYGAANVFYEIMPEIKILDEKLINLLVETKQTFDNNLFIKKGLFGSKTTLIDKKGTEEAVNSCIDYLKEKQSSWFCCIIIWKYRPWRAFYVRKYKNIFL